MKKYYCADCKKFKNRYQLKRVDDTRVAFYECRWCHNHQIYKTEDIMHKLIDETLDEENDLLNSRHGSYL